MKLCAALRPAFPILVFMLGGFSRAHAAPGDLDLSFDPGSLAVADAAGGYPVRIDPRFADEDWSSMGEIPGVDGIVRAAVADALGNFYIGGDFTVAGKVIANGIAKWDGNAWSALGTGMDGDVYALAVLGTNLYAAGNFTTAGGITANRVAQWNGTAWSALGSGMNASIRALAVVGTDLYAGGRFHHGG